MATLLRRESAQKNMLNDSQCKISLLLAKHGWHPSMTLLGAETALAESPAYTYVIYPRNSERGFTISFINKHGFVEHHPLTLISPKQGIWRNGHPPHVGKLEKVISDVLGHNEGQPLL